jgi:hypothetical protein
MKNKNLGVIIAIVLMLFVAVFVARKNSGKGTTVVSTSKAQVMVPCTATLADKPQKVEGWNTYMYPAPREATTPDQSKRIELQVSYSRKLIEARTEPSNIYYRLERPDRGDLPREMKRIIEICNSDNKTVATGTTRDTKATETSEHVQASVTYMQSYYIERKPGTFRVDGFIFINGKWILTDRIENVVITE